MCDVWMHVFMLVGVVHIYGYNGDVVRYSYPQYGDCCCCAVYYLMHHMSVAMMSYDV